MKFRVNLPNNDGRLKPEMFVRATVKSHTAAGGRVLDASLAGKWISPMHAVITKDKPGDCDICGMPLVRAKSLGYVTAEPSSAAKPLVVPATAVLLTGTLAIVYVQIRDADRPTYEGREIVIGQRADDFYLVKEGLKEGDLVVTNGNFKLDSALQISAKPSMMTSGGVEGLALRVESQPHNHSQHSTLNPQLTDAMQSVVDQFTIIRKSIEAAELANIRKTFIALGEKIDAVPTDLIGPDMRPQWFEVAMLLRNDVAEGREVNSVQEADRVFALTRQHLSRTLAITCCR